jgi:hypothetical protein
VIGQIVNLHVRDDVYDPASGRLDMHRLCPVGAWLATCTRTSTRSSR